MDFRRNRTELAWQHRAYSGSTVIRCDSHRSGRSKLRSPARQAGPTKPHPSTSILPEWTFGEAELSSYRNTRQTTADLSLTAGSEAICCDLRRSGRGRPRSPARQAAPTKLLPKYVHSAGMDVRRSRTELVPTAHRTTAYWRLTARS